MSLDLGGLSISALADLFIQEQVLLRGDALLLDIPFYGYWLSGIGHGEYLGFIPIFEED